MFIRLMNVVIAAEIGLFTLLRVDFVYEKGVLYLGYVLLSEGVLVSFPGMLK